MKTRYAASKPFIQCHIEMDADMSLYNSHYHSDQICSALLLEFPGAEIIIHLDPYGYEEKVNYRELIEDQSSYAAHDQEPCLSVIDVERWDLEHGNESGYAFPKNGTYYILGIFRTYFDHKEYNHLPLRKGIEKIVEQRNAEGVVWTKESPFVRAMIYLGLDEVKKTYPEAIFYGYELLERYDKD
ncbi:MAG: hypothetical protein K2X94_03145 [Amoebophilaceae bacterium]|nr:hypothetical protein [Amoebophilaceae bacterium]